MASCTNTSDSTFVDGVTEALADEGKVNMELLEWTREPQSFYVNGDTLTITTAPHTDLWQRTYYHLAREATVFLTTFSTRLFQAPHEGHLPAHLGDS